MAIPAAARQRSQQKRCNAQACLQALICTALNLPPTYFRKLLQSNAATTVLDFQPMPDDPSVTQVIVDRLNQVSTLAPARPCICGCLHGCVAAFAEMCRHPCLTMLRLASASLADAAGTCFFFQHVAQLARKEKRRSQAALMP